MIRKEDPVSLAPVAERVGYNGYSCNGGGSAQPSGRLR